MLMFNLILSMMIAILLLGLIFFVNKKSIIDREKSSPFECGFSTASESRNPISLRFFIVTLIFLVFDIELILMFPFMFKLHFSIIPQSMFLFVMFLSLLSLGLFLEWNQLMLEWK